MEDAPVPVLLALRLNRKALHCTLKSAETARVATIHDQDLSISFRHELANALHDAGIQDGAAGSLLSIGKPRVHITHMQDMVEFSFPISNKEPLSNERRDNPTSRVSCPIRTCTRACSGAGCTSSRTPPGRSDR